ncbi:MAG: TolC family protein [Nitrospira sp.]|nr:TolC family protein [Nitrospira sp.]MBS0155960.1 TolC family protein [Nitrospira sp.]MBS0167572.1 TolC family protein [Nitrospira sp.]MBX3325986.1 TolC family protein [Nitrospira sp.]
MRRRVLLAFLCAITITFGGTRASAEPDGQFYSLDMIVDLTLARNPLVSLAEGTIEQQKGQQTAAGAYPNPTVGGAGGHGMLRDTSLVGPESSLTRQSLTEYNVTVGQPVEWPALRSARQRVADLGVATANVGMLEARLNLASQVKVAFYDLLLAQQDADLAKQNLDTVEGVARIVRARVKSGEAPQFESIKAEVEVLKARQQLARADNLVRINRVAVDTLTGGALGPTYMVHGEFRMLPRDLRIEGLMARMMDQHPTIQRLLKSVEQSDWKIEFERQARVPSVTVNGSYWREIGREAFQGGLSVPLPLWYRRQGEIASSLGAKRRDEAELLRTRNELGRAVYQHYQDVRTTAELIEVFDKGLLKQAQEALRLAQFSFQQGASSLLEVLDAQRVQRQILLDYGLARHDLSVSLARLEQAVGGML